MEVFRKHKIAVWLLTIIFSILIFTLGVIIAQEPVYESDPFNDDYNCTFGYCIFYYTT